MNEREAFEAWWPDQLYDGHGLYRAPAQYAWSGWKARAAVEADRAQRVPDGWALVPIEPDDALMRPFYACPPDELSLAWRAMHMVAAKKSRGLASTPAPAQREPSEATIAQIDREIEAMLTQVESGSFPELPTRTLELAREVAKLIVAKHQEPPQQERGPMTNEIEYQERIFRLEVALKKSLEDRHPMTETQRRALIARAGDLTDGLNQDDFADEIVKAVERHHGIKE